MAGYSETPLAKKLGIKKGFTASIINAPAYYFELFNDMLIDIIFSNDPISKKDFIHFFTEQKEEYLAHLPKLKEQLKSNGMIWVSWPKRSSKVVTDITEDIIRNYALQIGLVDIKVCAVDEVWSGLKLVIPVKDRV
jgi:hypothetical protein